MSVWKRARKFSSLWQIWKLWD